MDKALSANKQKKAVVVSDLTDKVTKATSVVIADYRGLKHKQLEELRRTLKKSNAELVISKNRLMLRALGDKAEGVKDALNDSTATLFSYGDEIAPLKELLKFFKATGFGKAKAGILGTQSLSDKDVAKLATLPNKEVLLGRLVGQLMAPLSGLHNALSWNIRTLVYALNAVKEKKS
jgi:large subunit ribosomal protein L10